MSDRFQNDALPEPMAKEGKTAMDLIDGYARPPETKSFQAKQILKKPIEKLKGGEHQHGNEHEHANTKGYTQLEETNDNMRKE